MGRKPINLRCDTAIAAEAGEATHALQVLMWAAQPLPCPVWQSHRQNHRSRWRGMCVHVRGRGAECCGALHLVYTCVFVRALSPKWCTLVLSPNRSETQACGGPRRQESYMIRRNATNR